MILDGKTISEEMLQQIQQTIEKMQTPPTLCAILVGNNPASEVYIAYKQKAAEKLGINFELKKLPEDITQEALESSIQAINEDSTITGLIIQMPLPKHLDAYKAINTIDPKKDVDGLNSINIGKIVQWDESGLISCTPLGIIQLLESYNIPLEGKHVVVIGRSTLVGKPIGILCLNRGATVTYCHSKTPDLSVFTKQADIIISATGQKHLITPDMVADKQVLIDVGITRGDDNKLYGDVDYKNMPTSIQVTPVPGGVGPMTVAMIMQNVVKAYQIQK